MSIMTIYSKRLGSAPAGTGNGTKVTIYSIKDEENIIPKMPKSIYIPKSSQNYSAGPETKFIDTLQRERVFTVTGFLTSNATYSGAIVARNLQKIVNAGGNIIFNLGGLDYNGAIMKYQLTRIPMDWIMANTSAAVTAGAGKTLTLDNNGGFVAGDSISIIGSVTTGNTTTEYCEMTTITSVGSGNIVATIVNSYDSGAEVYFHNQIGDILEYDIVIQLLVGTNALG